jgi:hypothetical protein
VTYTLGEAVRRQHTRHRGTTATTPPDEDAIARVAEAESLVELVTRLAAEPWPEAVTPS